VNGEWVHGGLTIPNRLNGHFASSRGGTHGFGREAYDPRFLWLFDGRTGVAQILNHLVPRLLSMVRLVSEVADGVTGD
jgi:hypothetical protein